MGWKVRAVVLSAASVVFVVWGCGSGAVAESGGDIVLLLQSFVPGFQVVLIGGVICGLGLQEFAG